MIQYSSMVLHFIKACKLHCACHVVVVALVLHLAMLRVVCSDHSTEDFLMVHSVPGLNDWSSRNSSPDLSQSQSGTGAILVRLHRRYISVCLYLLACHLSYFSALCQ